MAGLTGLALRRTGKAMFGGVGIGGRSLSIGGCGTKSVGATGFDVVTLLSVVGDVSGPIVAGEARPGAAEGELSSGGDWLVGDDVCEYPAPPLISVKRKQNRNSVASLMKGS
jgi:hypothetical protein